MPFAHDPHRPRYHFLPPSGWMNDPNGLIQWDGAYHLFYQHNPHGAFHATMHWGHAVSRNLVHWQHLPIALAPTPGGPDKDGCYSGCAVDHDGVPTLVYTGVRPQVQCLATSDDGLLTWRKHPANPVIAAPPEGLAVTGFRDPWAWREGDTWNLLIGSGIKGVGGTVLLYQSRDLVHWEYRHPFCVGAAAETGTMWECPTFFPLGDRHVLIVSPPPFRRVIAFIGTYAGQRFTPERWEVLDADGCYYAAQTFADDRGRRLIFGWLLEGRNTEAQRAAGWSGVQSLPRVLTLRSDGVLGMEPAPEVEVLRGNHARREPGEIPDDAAFDLPGVRGDSLEIAADIDPGNAARVGLCVRCSPDGAEQTRLV